MDVEYLPLLLSPLFRFANAASGWLLTYALHSTAWILAAWLVTSLWSVRLAPTRRHAVWTAALLGGFVTAALQLTGTIAPLAGAQAVALPGPRSLGAILLEVRDGATGAGTVRVRALLPERPPRIRHLATAASAGGEGPTVARVMVIALSPAFLLVATWALVAAALVGRFRRSDRLLERLLAGRRDISQSVAGVALRHLCQVAGFRRPVALSMSDALAAPAAISEDEIVLPPRVASDLSLAELEALLAHELAHVARRDTLWLRLAHLVTCVAWFQPLNLLARRHMRLAAEFSADAWAARTTQQPLQLARALARVAEWVASPVPPRVHAALVLGAAGSPLLARVRRLTSDRGATTGTASRPGAAIASLLMGVAATAAIALALPSLSFGALGHERLERREFVVRHAAAWERAAPSPGRDVLSLRTPPDGALGEPWATRKVVRVLMSPPLSP